MYMYRYVYLFVPGRDTLSYSLAFLSCPPRDAMASLAKQCEEAKGQGFKFPPSLPVVGGHSGQQNYLLVLCSCDASWIGLGSPPTARATAAMQ